MGDEWIGEMLIYGDSDDRVCDRGKVYMESNFKNTVEVDVLRNICSYIQAV